MGAYEVTQSEYVEVMGDNPSQVFKAEGKLGWDWPVESVTWDQANDFCNKLSERPEEKRAGRVYRLPTEAEWEYAFCAGAQKPHPIDPVKASGYAWTRANSGRALHPVGKLKPNAWGLYDMHGNVFEWCSDAQAGAHKECKGTGRVLRGSSFPSDVGHLRFWCDPDKLAWDFGFRVVCVNR
jgi:formylglycine-generating enzyme required for sulfatase activity